MVDCFDRIAVQMTELALEPVRMLAERAMLGAVSLRTPSGGKRYLVTVAKRFPESAGGAARYAWAVEQVDASGDAVAGGARATSGPEEWAADPEAAYWAAVNGMCAMGDGAP